MRYGVSHLRKRKKSKEMKGKKEERKEGRNEKKEGMKRRKPRKEAKEGSQGRKVRKEGSQGRKEGRKREMKCEIWSVTFMKEEEIKRVKGNVR